MKNEEFATAVNKITVTSPLLPDLEEFHGLLKEIWASKWVTNMGQFHKQLERALAEYLKVPYLSLFTNGTLPLLTALQALRIKGEVITTPYSFVATTHAIWWNGCTPVFVDIEEDTCGIDPEKIEAAITPQTAAIMPVHCYGHPVKMKRIQEIADRYGLKVIYDAAHAFGVEVAPQPPKGGAMDGAATPPLGGWGASWGAGASGRVRHSADPVYYGKLKDYAKENRNHPTEAEELLWNILSGKGLDGVKFRRQHIIGQYIADFACIDKGLVIELDGHHHSLPPVCEDDAIRTEYLNNEGYKVIRFTNEQVLHHLDDTIKQIRSALQAPPLGGWGAGRGAGVSVLSFGDMSTLSFHATKVFNTLEGGALVVHDEQTKRHIDNLKNFGFRGETEVVAPGINSKMDEVRCAYGLLNLKQVDAAIEARRKVAEKYVEALKEVQGIRMLEAPQPPKGGAMDGAATPPLGGWGAGWGAIRHNYSYFPIFVDAKEYGMTRDELYSKLQAAGVYGRRYFYPLISTFSPYRNLPSATPENLPVATRIANEVICLPMHHALSNEDVQKVIGVIHRT